ncbi:hypothetical protein [Paraburkholderia lycopersici]|uniref:Uncharacterized protein n=1 Tax=Paraburkholderia lycopersici TaxID=416944 RepID=A0A1G7D5X2_9BURK|nr:hypothetical protein [Paraburkholderia lycopersici]SDE46962.1 hypothetical protein SAMN05421548_1537 [Paraburkholderia lycopersici]
MLELTEKEWAALQAADERTFVSVIRNDIVKDRPELANDPQLLDRLNAAYTETKRIGFTDDRHVVQFLYLESIEPSFYQKPGIAAWLGKKGVPPEQRFDMVMDVSRVKLRDKKGE